MAMRRLSGDVGEASPPWAPRSDNAGSVEDVIAGLADLDANGLRLQWRNHLGGTPPAHLPRWLLLRVLGYQIQVAALGGRDKATLRVIRQPSVEQLVAHIDAFIADYNQTARPFLWTKSEVDQNAGIGA
jgi:hypothetical protein